MGGHPPKFMGGHPPKFMEGLGGIPLNSWRGWRGIIYIYILYTIHIYDIIYADVLDVQASHTGRCTVYRCRRARERTRMAKPMRYRCNTRNIAVAPCV